LVPCRTPKHDRRAEAFGSRQRGKITISQPNNLKGHVGEVAKIYVGGN
jgi:hypothetical protein